MQTYLILLIYIIVIMFIGFLVNLLTSKMMFGWVYRILVAPGVIIHEFSHAFGCIITGAHIQSINVFKRDGGELKHTGSPIPIIGNVVISLMPIIVGIVVLYFLPNLLFAHSTNALGVLSILKDEVAPPQINRLDDLNNFQFSIFNFQSPAVETFSFTTGQAILQSFSTLNSQLSILSWQFWAFIYLIFNLAATMAPSKQDIKVIWWDLLVIAGIFYLLSIFNVTLNIATFLPLFVLSLVYSIIVLVIVGMIYIVLKII